jgi:hypothetical protein
MGVQTEPKVQTSESGAVVEGRIEPVIVQVGRRNVPFSVKNLIALFVPFLDSNGAENSLDQDKRVILRHPGSGTLC